MSTDGKQEERRDFTMEIADRMLEDEKEDVILAQEKKTKLPQITIHVNEVVRAINDDSPEAVRARMVQCLYCKGFFSPHQALGKCPQCRHNAWSR